MAIKFSWPRLLAAAIIYTIIGQIVNTLGAMMDMSYYIDPAYYTVWSKLMMPGPGPPGAEFYYASTAFSFISALIFVLVYAVIKGSVPGKGWKNKGLMFGFLVFLISGLPMTMTLMLLINLPWGLLISWLFQGLIVYLIGGLVAARLMK